MSTSRENFEGGVFHESIPGGRSGATISIARGELVADTNGPPSQRFTIPLSQCKLDIGGASGRMIFCRTSDGALTIFCEDKRFANELDFQSGGIFASQLQALKKGQRAEAGRFHFWVAVSAVALAALMVLGYYSILGAAKVAVKALPISVDQTIGNTAFNSMDVGRKLDSNHPASKLVVEIVEKLKPHARLPDMKFKVTVVEGKEVNAFALPGGQIVVFTGLIKEAKSAEQIAGVLAHEMSHATLRHGIERVSQSLGVVAAIQLLVGDVGGLVALGAQVAQTSILTSYSRTAETEADLEGVRMLHAAKIDPQAMAEFFQLLKDKMGDLPDAVAWISTHPQHETRVENINNHKKTLDPVEYEPLKLDLKAAQDAL
jgi:Zn-dependent protease with chaperone function